MESWSRPAQLLDLSHLPAEDLDTLGPKLATMLEAIFRKIKPDLSTIPDKWSAPPQVLTGPDGLRVEIVRLPDGSWRIQQRYGDSFGRDARIPGVQERSDHVRRHGLATPRQTLITFFRAVNNRDDDEAAHCLALIHFSPWAPRDDVGPVLAFKLKSVIDHIGRVYLEEISNQPEGPRLVLYRGPAGRITIARGEDNSDSSWRFTAATVDQIETMYDRLLDQPIDPNVAAPSHVRVEPAFASEPGIWLRMRVPPPLHSRSWACRTINGSRCR